MRFRRVCLTGAALAVAACGSQPPPAAPPAVAPVPPPPVVHPTGPGVRFGPGAQRYVIHSVRRVEQELAGQQPTEMGYRVFVSARIAGPTDSAGYLLTHAVDSIVPDSGAFVPPNVNFAAARGLRLSGRLAPWGEVRGVTASDSVQARMVTQLLGNLREFYPRLPIEGLRPGATWTDTSTTSERGAGSDVVVSAIRQSTAATDWEQCPAARCVRITVQGPYTVLGTGEQGGQPFEMVGNGTRSALEFVSADGRYLGGEVRDSASLSVNLPAQGMTILIRQTLHSTVTVRP